MIKKPDPTVYGYIDNNSFDGEPSGWCLEGGEEAYNRDLQIWEANPPSQEEFQNQVEVPSSIKELQEACERTTVDSLTPRHPTFASVKDWYDKTTNQKKSMEDGFKMLNDMVSKQIKSEARDHFINVAADLLRLIIHYDCRPSEITEIVRVNPNSDLGPFKLNWWETGRIIDIKINKKD